MRCLSLNLLEIRWRESLGKPGEEVECLFTTSSQQALLWGGNEWPSGIRQEKMELPCKEVLPDMTHCASLYLVKVFLELQERNDNRRFLFCLRSGIGASLPSWNRCIPSVLRFPHSTFMGAWWTRSGKQAHVKDVARNDLRAMGINRPAHRKKIKSEIAKLNIGDGLPDFVPSSVQEWLRILRLEEYLPFLMQQGINSMQALLDIQWEDLEDIGIFRLGHQKKIMLALKRLQDLMSGRRQPAPGGAPPAHLKAAQVGPVQRKREGGGPGFEPLTLRSQQETVTIAPGAGSDSSLYASASMRTFQQRPPLVEPQYAHYKTPTSPPTFVMPNGGTLSSPHSNVVQVEVCHEPPPSSLHMGPPSPPSPSHRQPPPSQPRPGSLPQTSSNPPNASMESLSACDPQIPPAPLPLQGLAYYNSLPSSGNTITGAVPPWPRRAFEDGDITPTNNFSAPSSTSSIINNSVAGIIHHPPPPPSGTPSSASLILGGGTLPRASSMGNKNRPVAKIPASKQALPDPPMPPEFLKVQLRQVRPPVPPARGGSDGGADEDGGNRTGSLPLPSKLLLRGAPLTEESSPSSGSSSSSGGSPNNNLPPHGVSNGPRMATGGYPQGGESSSSSESEREGGPGSPSLGFRQRRQDSNASFKSTSSTESDSFPFANDNAGTIKSTKGGGGGTASRVPNGPSPAKVASSAQAAAALRKPGASANGKEAGDVLNDIGNMLADLTDELDAILSNLEARRELEDGLVEGAVASVTATSTTLVALLGATLVVIVIFIMGYYVIDNVRLRRNRAANLRLRTSRIGLLGGLEATVLQQSTHAMPVTHCKGLKDPYQVSQEDFEACRVLDLSRSEESFRDSDEERYGKGRSFYPLFDIRNRSKSTAAIHQQVPHCNNFPTPAHAHFRPPPTSYHWTQLPSLRPPPTQKRVRRTSARNPCANVHAQPWIDSSFPVEEHANPYPLQTMNHIPVRRGVGSTSVPHLPQFPYDHPQEHHYSQDTTDVFNDFDDEQQFEVGLSQPRCQPHRCEDTGHPPTNFETHNHDLRFVFKGRSVSAVNPFTMRAPHQFFSAAFNGAGEPLGSSLPRPASIEVMPPPEAESQQFQLFSSLKCPAQALASPPNPTFVIPQKKSGQSDLSSQSATLQCVTVRQIRHRGVATSTAKPWNETTFSSTEYATQWWQSRALPPSKVPMESSELVERGPTFCASGSQISQSPTKMYQAVNVNSKNPQPPPPTPFDAQSQFPKSTPSPEGNSPLNAFSQQRSTNSSSPLKKSMVQIPLMTGTPMIKSKQTSKVGSSSPGFAVQYSPMDSPTVVPKTGHSRHPSNRKRSACTPIPGSQTDVSECSSGSNSEHRVEAGGAHSERELWDVCKKRSARFEKKGREGTGGTVDDEVHSGISRDTKNYSQDATARDFDSDIFLRGGLSSGEVTARQ
ncbi:unnamed protein product [Cyprideis torosa]|uniref:Uncharacterized protein n=1 Tax=Cyprideis torosa TaxID=163714 RepID=A0A7R8W7M7_9CRUS|nr:unnamed protein product [Cyprideis torosa]CAG0887736.1 unnamed protein product [Cyprideis torosa]